MAYGAIQTELRNKNDNTVRVKIHNGTSEPANTAIQANDSFSIDPFGRWRTSSPFTLFDSKQLYGASTFFFDDQETSGSGTSSAHSTDEAATTMSVGTAAGTRVRQTKMRFNYQPGKGQEILVTCAEFDTDTGITKRMGYFDDDNGLFFESDEGTVKVVRRTHVSGSAVDNAVAQANWNLDKMDGTGPSGVTLDFTKTQIGFIDFEWLGVGRVRMGWVIDGKIYYCHTFDNTNNLATVYMSTPNLPIRYEISNDGNGAADDFVHICCSVMSEGGVEDTGTLNGVDTGSTKIDLATAGTLYPILGIKLLSTHLDATVKPINFNVLETAGIAFRYSLHLNPTLSSALSYTSVASSGFQYAVGDGTITATAPGVVLNSGYVGNTKNAQAVAQENLRTPWHLGSLIDGTPDELVLCVTPLTANADIFASINLRSQL